MLRFPNMQACDPLSPDAYKWWVHVPLASPYAFRWIEANDPRNPDSGQVVFVRSPQAAPISGNDGVIHFGTNRERQNPPYGKWHHISISVDGEIMTSVAELPPDPPDLDGNSNKSSLLKARIRLGMGTARPRTFDFDIGAGVEFEVACYHVLDLKVLIPDPTIPIPDAPPPDGADPGPQQLTTILTPTIYFTTLSGRQHNPLTYTVPIVFGENDSDAFVPRQRDAVSITAVSDAVGGVTTAIIDFLYVPTRLLDATYNNAEVPAFFLLGSVFLPVGTSVFSPTLIPGNTNAFRIRRQPGSANGIVNFVQVLNT